MVPRLKPGRAHFALATRFRYDSHIRPNRLSGSNRYGMTERFVFLQQIAVSKNGRCKLVLVREREQRVVPGTNGIDREVSIRVRHASVQQNRIAAQSEFRKQDESRAPQRFILAVLYDSRSHASGITQRHFESTFPARF